MCGMAPNLRLRCHVGGTLDRGILSPPVWMALSLAAAAPLGLVLRPRGSPLFPHNWGLASPSWSLQSPLLPFLPQSDVCSLLSFCLQYAKEVCL